MTVADRSTLIPIAILVPVLGRPHRVRPLLEDIEQATPGPHTVVFIASTYDHPTMLAVLDVGGCPNVAVRLLEDDHRQHGEWARKINLGYRTTTEPLMLLCGDDVHFHEHWHDVISAVAECKAWGVLGTNDLGNPRVMDGTHSTHPVVARWYADEHGTIDGPGALVVEHYDHNYVDDELIGTARFRRQWAFCGNAHIEHMHPNWGKGQRDAVYDLGRRNFSADQALYRQRRQLWGEL